MEALLESSKEFELNEETRNLIAKLLNQFREHKFGSISREEKILLNRLLNVPEKLREFMDSVVAKKMPEFYVMEAWRLLLEIYANDTNIEDPTCFYTQFDENIDKDEEVNFRWSSVSCHIGDKFISLYTYQDGEETTLSKEENFPLTLEGRKAAAKAIRNRAQESSTKLISSSFDKGVSIRNEEQESVRI